MISLFGMQNYTNFAENLSEPERIDRMNENHAKLTSSLYDVDNIFNLILHKNTMYCQIPWYYTDLAFLFFIEETKKFIP